MIKKEEAILIKQMAKRMRLKALKMALDAGNNGAHLGPAMSCMEIFAVLYSGVLRFRQSEPTWQERDRLIVSKAHCVLAYYTALAEVGFIMDEELNSFEKNGTSLAGQPVVDMSMGIEYSGGSLGQALPVGIGIALDAKKKEQQHRVYVLLGDGECDEGSNWEAFLAAAHYRLDNLCVIIDKNQLQYDGKTDDIMNLGDLSGKLKAFGWQAIEVDGHNVEELWDALLVHPDKVPFAVIANTVKGKGVSFMENVREWHHGRLTQAQYQQAVAEIEEGSETI